MHGRLYAIEVGPLTQQVDDVTGDIRVAALAPQRDLDVVRNHPNAADALSGAFGGELAGVRVNRSSERHGAAAGGDANRRGVEPWIRVELLDDGVAELEVRRAGGFVHDSGFHTFNTRKSGATGPRGHRRVGPGSRAFAAHSSAEKAAGLRTNPRQSPGPPVVQTNPVGTALAGQGHDSASAAVILASTS
jgi:hypothetical protein